MVKVILLCAGYGTRFGELGERCAKSLLSINGRPLIEYIIEKVNEIDEVDDVIVVSNDKFYKDFVRWREDYGHPRVKILNDGSTSNENRRGALKDLEFVLEKEDLEGEDVLVLAGDNLIEFNLREFYVESKKIGKSLIAVYDVIELEKVRNKHGVVVLHNDEIGNRVVEFQEKPSEPGSTMKSFCCYLFKPEVQIILSEYLFGKDSKHSDATGFFLEYLCKTGEVYAYDVGFGMVRDIGSLESLREVREKFERREDIF